MQKETLRFETAMMSEPGGRRENQDCCDYLVQDAIGCWVLADGLGGHQGGRVAAKIAVSALLDAFRVQPACSKQAVARYLDAANSAIVAAQRCDPALSSMRTTAVMLVCDSRYALWSHVGDSRLYYLRDGLIQFQTRDHTVPQALCDAGKLAPDAIRFHAERNWLLRSLGNAEDPEAEPAPSLIPLKRGDAFLLCSDGLWEYVTESEMEADLAKSRNPAAWLRKLETRVGERAGGRGDNYSAIAVLIQ
jgi:serine/threonine protein phosphatase PrpC